MKRLLLLLSFVCLVSQAPAYGATGIYCLQCHGDKDFYSHFKGTVRQSMLKAMLKGMYVSAGTFSTSVHSSLACTQCHAGVSAFPHTPTAYISKTDIPLLCSRCHAAIYNKYIQSIHWRAVKSGINAAPVCTDCHGVHSILKPTNPEARVFPENIPRTCSSCHDSVKLAQKYNLPLNRLTTYENSFHGIALKFGDLKAANCASCHGVHDILPSSDQLSSINKSNLAKTCGKCHPNATENFLKSPVHIVVSKYGEKGPYIVRVFYTWFIGTLITLFIIYVVFDLINTRRKKREASRHE